MHSNEMRFTNHMIGVKIWKSMLFCGILHKLRKRVYTFNGCAVLMVMFCFTMSTGCSLFAPPKLVLNGEKLDASDSPVADIQVKHITSVRIQVPQQTPANAKTRDGRIGGVGNIMFKWYDLGSNVNAQYANINSLKNGIIIKQRKKFPQYNYRKISFKVTANHAFPMSAMPIITADDKLLVLDAAGILYAFNTNTGKVVWKKTSITKTKGKAAFSAQNSFISGGMALDDDEKVVFITNGTNHVIAFNTLNGDKIWDLTVSSVTRSIPTICKNILVIQMENDTVYGVDKKSGKLLWVYVGFVDHEEVRSSSSSAPIVYDGDRILLQNTVGNVAVLDAKNGQEIFSLEPHYTYNTIRPDMAIINYAPILHNKIVYFTNNFGEVSAMDTMTNRIKWRKKVDVRQQFWIAMNTIYAITDSGQLIAMDVNSGNTVWAVDLHNSSVQNNIKSGKTRYDGIFSPPIMIGDMIFVVCNNGVLLGFDPITGQNTKAIAIHKWSTLPIMVHNNSFYVISNYGTISRYLVQDIAKHTK